MKLEKLYLMIVNNLFDGIYFVDMDRNITFWNKAAENITGYKAEEIIGLCCQDNLLNHIDEDGRALCRLGCPLFTTLIDGRQRKDKVFLQHKDGYRISVQINIFPIIEDETIVGAVEIFTPSSPVIFDSTRLSRLWESPLSDDPRRLSDHGEVESYIAYRLHEFGRFQRGFCVIFANIDAVESMREQYGIEAVNNLYKSVNKSIGFNIRPSDYFSFIEGKGFIGVFNINKNYEATLLAEKVRILMTGSEIPRELGSLSVTASVGVTVARENDSIQSIVDRAYDLMCQCNKNNIGSISSDA